MDDHTHTIQILVDPAVGPEHGLRAGQILAATERLAYRRRREQGMHGTALISTPRWSVTSPLDGRTLHLYSYEAIRVTRQEVP